MICRPCRHVLFASASKAHAVRFSSTTCIHARTIKAIPLTHTRSLHSPANTLQPQQPSFSGALDVNVNSYDPLATRLHLHLRTHRCDRLVAEFRKAKETDTPISLDAYRALLLGCVRIGDPTTAVKVIRDVERVYPSSEIDKDLYVLTLQAAAATPDLKEGVANVIRLVGEFQNRLDDHPDAYVAVAEALLRGKAKEHAQGAILLLNRIASEPLPEKVVGLKMMAYALQGDQDNLLALFDSARQNSSPSLLLHSYAFQALIQCESLPDRFSLASEPYAELLALASDPNTHTVLDASSAALLNDATTAILNVLALRGDMESALTIRNGVRRALIKAYPLKTTSWDIVETADVGALKVFIGAAKEALGKSRSAVDNGWGSRDWLKWHDEWLGIYEDVQHRCRGYPLSEEACVTILQLHALAARVLPARCQMEGVMELLESMRQSGFVVTTEVFEILFEGWALAGYRSLGGQDATTAFRTNRVNRINGAKQALASMRAIGLKPTANCYAHLFTAFASPSDLQHLSTIFKDRELTAAIGPELLALEKEMLEIDGIHHTVETAGAMVVALAAVGQFQDAKQRFSDMRISGLKRDIKLYKDLIAVSATSVRGSEWILRDVRYSMLRDVGNLEAYGERTVVELYEGLIECCVRVGEVATAFAITRDMENIGIRKTAGVYNGLLGLCDAWGDALGYLGDRVVAEAKKDGMVEEGEGKGEGERAVVRDPRKDGDEAGKKLLEERPRYDIGGRVANVMYGL
ncbi:hypothetical protein HDV00_003903 [Rhizophlyctis rosea]|nr:hypothetical protein HDV00_003903 [Rhizophlyctis rosea]